MSSMQNQFWESGLKGLFGGVTDDMMLPLQVLQ